MTRIIAIFSQMLVAEGGREKSEEPHFEQNVAPGSLYPPHFLQNGKFRVYQLADI
jgi:hypothetical protein